MTPSHSSALRGPVSPPGFNAGRVASLIKEAVSGCSLDLSGLTVVTEAASGAYVVTPVLAAVAGATVHAVTRATAYGSVQDVIDETLDLADASGVAQNIQIVTAVEPRVLSQADIITNSGHVRPIDGGLLAHAKTTAVIPLMYEAWEFRASDVDLAECRARSIAVAGTNERHPSVDVFSFLGIMAVKLLLDAGVAVYRSQVLLLCDNEFRSFIERGLVQSGAAVQVATSAEQAPSGRYDAIVVALQPRSTSVLDAADAASIASRWPGAVVAQYWGDIDREALRQRAIEVWPPAAPGTGHMGILPSAVGPEPIVRLQCGGLKVGEILARARLSGASLAESLRVLEESGYGTLLDPPGDR
jgi:hypothetical protein